MENESAFRSLTNAIGDADEAATPHHPRGARDEGVVQVDPVAITLRRQIAR